MGRNPKLTLADREVIVSLQGISTSAALAARFGVARSTITDIWIAARDPLQEPASAGPNQRKKSALTGLFHHQNAEGAPKFFGNVEPDIDPLTEDGKSFMELGDSECRYSIGRDGDGQLRFCGCPRTGTTKMTAAYCGDHAAVVLYGKRVPEGEHNYGGTAPGAIPPIMRKIFGPLEIDTPDDLLELREAA